MNLPPEIDHILKEKDEQIRRMDMQLEMMVQMRKEMIELKQERLRLQMTRAQYQQEFDLERATTSLQDQRMTALCFEPLPQWPDELDDPAKSYKYRVASLSSRRRSEEERGHRRERRRDSRERNGHSRSERDRHESRRRSRSREREKERERRPERKTSGSHDRDGKWLPYWERTERHDGNREKTPPRRTEERRESDRRREPFPRRREPSSRRSHGHHQSDSKPESSSSSRHREADRAKELSKPSSSSSRPREHRSSKEPTPSPSSSRNPKTFFCSRETKSKSSTKEKPLSSREKPISSRREDSTKKSFSSSKPSTSKSSSSSSSQNKTETISRGEKKKGTVLPAPSEIDWMEQIRIGAMEEILANGWDDTMEEVDCMDDDMAPSSSLEPNDGLSAYERLQQRAAAIPGCDELQSSDDSDGEDSASLSAFSTAVVFAAEEKEELEEEDNDSGSDVIILDSSDALPALQNAQTPPATVLLRPSEVHLPSEALPPAQKPTVLPAPKARLLPAPPAVIVLVDPEVPTPSSASFKPKQIPNPPGTGKRARKRARQATLTAGRKTGEVPPVAVQPSGSATIPTVPLKLSRRQLKKAVYNQGLTKTMVAAAGGWDTITASIEKPIPTVIDLTAGKKAKKRVPKRASDLRSLLSVDLSCPPPPGFGPQLAPGPSHQFYSAPQPLPPFPQPQQQFYPSQFNSYQPHIALGSYSMPPPQPMNFTPPPAVDQTAIQAEIFLNSLKDYDKNLDNRGTRRRSRSRSPVKEPEPSPAEEKTTQHYYYTTFDKSGVPVPRIGKRTTDAPVVKRRKTRDEQVDNGEETDFDFMFK